MKYLVLGVWEGQGSPFTLSREMDLGFADVESKANEIIDFISEAGMGKDTLWEVFIFKSAQNYGDAPECVGCWNQEDGLFGEPDEETNADSEDEDDGD